MQVLVQKEPGREGDYVQIGMQGHACAGDLSQRRTQGRAMSYGGDWSCYAEMKLLDISFSSRVPMVQEKSYPIATK